MAVRSEDQPSLAEPLVSLKTSSWQTAIGWIHSALRSVASALQAEQTQRETDVQELRADARGMLERLHRLEARSTGALPSSDPAAGDLGAEVRRLEAKLGSFREQSAVRQSTEDELLKLRLDALQGEVAACLRPQDLAAEKLALQDLRKQCENNLHEEARAGHERLQTELADAAERLRERMQAHAAAFEERLRACESRLSSAPTATPIQTPPRAASEVSEPKEELTRRPGSTGSGAGSAGGASLESRVARLEKNVKAGLGSPPAADQRRLEEVSAQASRAHSEAQRVAQRAEALEARLSALDGLAASMVAGGDGATAAAVEALERRLEQRVDEKLGSLREQIAELEAPPKISDEEKVDKVLLEEVHKDLLFGTPASPSKSPAQAPSPDPLALINSTIAARAAGDEAPSPLSRNRTSSEVSQLQTQLQALAAQQDDRALRLEKELKALQQKWFESAAASASVAGPGSGEAASALATTLSHHDEELKNLAASVQGLQANVEAVASRREAAPAAPSPAPSSQTASAAQGAAPPAALHADQAKTLEERLMGLQRKVEAQAADAAAAAAAAAKAAAAAAAAATGSGVAPSPSPVAGPFSEAPAPAQDAAQSEARAGEALQRVAEAENRILQLAEEVASLSAGIREASAAAQDPAALEAAKADLLEAFAPSADHAPAAGEAAAAPGPNSSEEAGSQDASREAAKRGLDALLERLGGLEAKVSSHAESLRSLRQQLELGNSQASGHAETLRDLGARLARQEAAAATGDGRSAAVPAQAELPAEAAAESPAVAPPLADSQEPPATQVSRELQLPASLPAEDPLATAGTGLARLLALEDKVEAALKLGQEVARVTGTMAELQKKVVSLSQSVGALQAEAGIAPAAAAVLPEAAVVQREEPAAVVEPSQAAADLGQAHASAMQELRDQVASLAASLATQRSRLEEALGSEEAPENGSLYKEVKLLATELDAVRKRQEDGEERPEVQRLSAAFAVLEQQVGDGQQLAQEVERVSGSLAELQKKVESASLAEEEMQRLSQTVDSLSRAQSGGLQQEVGKLADSLESLRFRQDDFLVQLKAARASLQELPSLREEIRSQRDATESLAQSQAKAKEAAATEMQQLGLRLGHLEEKRLKQLGMDVQALQGALVHIQTELQKEVVIPDHILREIDAKSEARQEAMWAELHKHAEMAAHRADQLERSLSGRLLSLEHSTNALLQNEAHSRELEREMQKQGEWFAWRIAWLEWAATGEKRSFARPLLPPPATPAATCFKQPLTEDSELWAQEKAGPRRLRRAPLSAMPSAGAANSQRLAHGESSPAARTLATSSSAPDLVVGPGTGGAEKNVRLPNLG